MSCFLTRLGLKLDAQRPLSWAPGTDSSPDPPTLRLGLSVCYHGAIHLWPYLKPYSCDISRASPWPYRVILRPHLARLQQCIHLFCKLTFMEILVSCTPITCKRIHDRVPQAAKPAAVHDVSRAPKIFADKSVYRMSRFTVVWLIRERKNILWFFFVGRHSKSQLNAHSMQSLCDVRPGVRKVGTSH